MCLSYMHSHRGPCWEMHGQHQQWQHRLIALCVLLQNADDAKATTVRFVLDHSHYRTGTWANLSVAACVGRFRLSTCLCRCAGGQPCAGDGRDVSTQADCISCTQIIVFLKKFWAKGTLRWQGNTAGRLWRGMAPLYTSLLGMPLVDRRFAPVTRAGTVPGSSVTGIQ